MATAVKKTGPAAEQAPQARRLPVSKGVLWAGLTLGTFLAVQAVLHGLSVPLGVSLPRILGGLISIVLTFGLIIVAAIAVAERVRRYHRAVARHAWRHGRRGAAVTARTARRHGSTVRAWLVSKAGPRWENREHQPLMFRKLRGEPEGPAAEEVPAQEQERGAAPAPAGTSTPDDPEEGKTSMTVSKIAPENRARRAAARSGGAVPSEWGPVIAATADFEPEDDGELLGWMTQQVTGLSAWAEALVDFYEHCTQVIGIDPKASAMLHDVADAAAQAAETMGAAKARFTEHYELPREFAANGGLMTHDGRWVTGEGA
jgi:hypothetical protein